MSSNDTPQDAPAAQADAPIVPELTDDALLKSQSAETSAGLTEPGEERVAFAEQVLHDTATGATATGPGTTTINTQIVQAVEQICRNAVGRAGGIATAGLAQVTAQSTALAMLNAVQAQQNAQIAAGALVFAVVGGIRASADRVRTNPLPENVI